MGPWLTQKAKQFLLNKRPGDPGNPFVFEDDKAYMLYDALDIRNAFEGLCGLVVSFKWCGSVMCTLHVETGQLGEGQVISLTGIEGRMEVQLSST